ncbi:MAG: peptide chain release factor-like protein [Proteobacteria bacterium]|nr:peptide chain release factor-like protein [Pseudomonadota bacterium]
MGQPPATTAAFLALSDAALLAQCEVHTYRGSGPGGQKRNKTSSAVRLHHRPTGLAAQATRTRSQHENRRSALRALRLRLALEWRTPVAIEDYHPPAALSQWLAAASPPGPRSASFPGAVAALLDLFVACDCSVSAVAAHVGVGSAALAHRLLSDPALGQKVNELRSARNLRRLRPR